MAEYFAGFVSTPKGYSVLFPDLPGCTAKGATMEEAYQSAATALAAVLRTERGRIPAPSGREAVREKLSRETAAGRSTLIRSVNSFDAEYAAASRLYETREEGFGGAMAFGGGD